MGAHRPSPRSSPGLPGLQARSQALDEDAARAAPRPGAGRRPRRWVPGGWGGWGAGDGLDGDGLLSTGVVAVFEVHGAKGIPHMYSLHSWCGMAAFVLYLLQVRAGEHPDPPRGGKGPRSTPSHPRNPRSGSWAAVSSSSPVPPPRCVASTSPTTSSSASPSLPSPSLSACWASPRCCSSTSGG